MDLGQLKKTIPRLWGKYRLALAVILTGLVLLCLPGKQESQGQTPQPEEPSQITLQEELEQILSRVEGAGKVRVLLTLQSGEQTHYQTDSDSDDTGLRQDTVILTGTDRQQEGLVRRIDPPVYLGAVVVSQGADRASVRLALVEAVKTATGLRTDQISILKMK